MQTHMGPESCSWSARTILLQNEEKKPTTESLAQREHHFSVPTVSQVLYQENVHNSKDILVSARPV